jgi:hypothetical protein
MFSSEHSTPDTPASVAHFSVPQVRRAAHHGRFAAVADPVRLRTKAHRYRYSRFTVEKGRDVFRRGRGNDVVAPSETQKKAGGLR